MIDERYKLDLIRYHLGEIEDKGIMKKFFCPLCQFDRPKNKSRKRKVRCSGVSNGMPGDIIALSV